MYLSKLIQKLPKQSLFVLVSSSIKNRNNDVDYTYRNHSDFIYLTGLNSPQSALVIDNQNNIYLYKNKLTSHEKTWEGELYSDEDIAATLNISKNNILEYSNLLKDIPKYLLDTHSFYYNFSQHGYHNLDQKVFNIVYEGLNKSRYHGSSPNYIRHTYEVMHMLRMIKSKDEIFKMQKAAQISANAHIELMKFSKAYIKTHSHISEFAMKNYLESVFLKEGGHHIAYPSIVAVGSNSTTLHYNHYKDQGTAKDLVLVDAACEYQYYASDITRTFSIGGKFTQEQRLIYEIVLEAQKACILLSLKKNTLEMIHNKAIEVIVDGLWELNFFKKCKFFDTDKQKEVLIIPRNQKEVIEKKLYLPYYMHSTSHFLGLDVHDAGQYYINKKAIPLQENMVFTIEPGIYIVPHNTLIPAKFRGIGIRIEDDIVITKNGYSILSDQVPKEIYDIENL